MEQFWDMVNEFGWGREDPERSNALDGVRDAIAMQFNEFYGGDVNDLVSWQALCQVLRMANIPETVDGCKSVRLSKQFIIYHFLILFFQAIEGVFVNICDLVDYSLDNSRNLILHNNEVALSLYSRASGKIYPKDNAYAQGLLRYLLRRIFNPSATRGLVGGSGRGGRPGGRGRRL